MARKHRDRSWPQDPERLPSALVDNHTHLDHVLEVTDGSGWRTDEPLAGPSAPWPGREPLPPAEPSAPWPGREPSVADHLARAAAVGVTRVVQVGCDLPSVTWTDAMLRDPAVEGVVLGAVAVHPNEAVLHAGVREVAPDGLEPRPREHHDVPLDEAIATVARVATENPRVRAIGETGLDHFRAGERGRAAQREAFRAHIALAKELDLVLQIHDRDAHEDVVDVLVADGAPERTVFHCFSGDAALAAVCADHGWYSSFAGPVGYPPSSDLRAALRATPAHLLLLETDAPYLPPHPWRGRPNAPYLLATTAAQVAAERGTGLAELCAQVSRTSEELYGPW